MEDLFALIDAVKGAASKEKLENAEENNIAEGQTEEEEKSSKHPISAHIELVIEKKAARRLDYIYNEIPANNCQRCAKCCFNGPQVHFIEFLNIVRVINELPLEKKNAITKKVINYELLNLVTLDQECPFLFEKECAIYEARPLQCRIFALYPEEAYKANTVRSQESNQKVMQYYCQTHSIKLPEEVLSYDVEQCGNNLDPEGKPIIINDFERMSLVNRIREVEASVIPYELEADEAYTSFSRLFLQLYFEEKDFEEFKLEATKEFLKKGKSQAVEDIVEELFFPEVL